MREKCLWTNRHADELVSIRVPRTNAWGRVVGEQSVFVLPGHERQVRAFADRAARYGRLFLVLLLVATLAMLGFGAAGWMRAVGTSLACMGLTALVLPFATPQTVEMFGLRTAIVMARFSGVLLVALGYVIGSGMLDG